MATFPFLDEDEEAKSPTKKLLKPPTSLKRDFTILSKPTIDPDLVKKIKSENSMLKERLEQAVHLSDMYREQVNTNWDAKYYLVSNASLLTIQNR